MYALKKNNTQPLYILCMLIPQTIPLIMLMLVCVWYEEATPRGDNFTIGSLLVDVFVCDYCWRGL